MNAKRIVAAKTGDGHITLIEENIPPVKPGAVLVEVHNSLVSPGTELGGWRSFTKEHQNPKSLPSPSPQPFGYSNAGIILEVGDNVNDFKVGDRVACIGGDYALHTNYAVVPHNLCAELPENVTFAQGSYAMLAATGLQAVRRGRPQLGENTAVVGLGLLGQLTAQLYQLSGSNVIGWGRNDFYNQIAQKWGIDQTVLTTDQDQVSATLEFTNRYGLDSAVLAFGGNGDEVYGKIKQCLKCSPDGHLMGRIIIVGAVSITCSFEAANTDIRIAARTGPGYHDETWELGQDYPPVFMRWTTRTNIQTCMQLISKGKLNLDCLTTHTIPLDHADQQISDISKDPGKILGLVFEMKH